MHLKEATILVVDDDPDMLAAVKMLLKTEAGEVITEKNPENILSLLREKSIDVVLLDMNFNSSVNTGNEGLFWLRKIRAVWPDLLVIMITAYGDIDLAVRAVKEGAADFVVKPWNNKKLIAVFKDVLKDNSGEGKKVAKDIINYQLLGESERMQDVFRKIKKIAPTEANILILGENGTGKDLVALALHEYSFRAAKPFVKTDVGALTEGLFESELFGYKKGAFTDAREDRKGRFEVANGGTLFLDEIGNISLQQQSKLLTVLQNRQVTRLGAHKATPVDIRLVCATNLPITALADESRFRKDLIYRINTIEIVLPPLRERGEDVMLLARHFAKNYADKYLKPQPSFSETARTKLEQYAFPGNVRELQYVIERAVIMAEGDKLDAEDIIFSPIETRATGSHEEKETNLKALERNTILKVIKKNNGNITRAAKELGLTRTALYRRMSKYDIE